MSSPKPWYEFSDRLERTALHMFDVLELPKERQSEIYAIKLLARTISNFNGVMVLLDKNLIVEARTIMRCCWANAFYLAEIARGGEKFVEEMLRADLINRRTLGQRLLECKLLDHPGDSLRSFLKSLRALKNKSRTPKEIADGGPMSNGYLIYMTASDDAAHPTVRSLSRHTREEQEPGVISALDVIAPTDPAELIETIDFACGALLGACYAFGETMGGSIAAPEVKERLAEWEQLKTALHHNLTKDALHAREREIGT